MGYDTRVVPVVLVDVAERVDVDVITGSTSYQIRGNCAARQPNKYTLNSGPPC